MTTQIRRIQPDDGQVLRDVRLRALLDTPSAFARTHAEEADYGHDTWTHRAQVAAASNDSVYFLSFPHGSTSACGMVGAYRPDDATIPDLVSMWVDPNHRGTPVASALVSQIIEWSRAAGYPSVELWVTRGNDRAKAFYERCGFVETGEFAPLPSDPCLDEIRMKRSLRS